MKTTKRAAFILRVIGWVLIGIAIASSIYVISTSGAAWSSMRTALKACDLDTSVIARARFDGEYYAALTSAANNKNRSENERVSGVISCFSELQNEQEKLTENTADAYIAWFLNGLDADEYLAFYESRESSEETRIIRDAFEYLDKLGAPSGKGGKLALMAASCEPDVQAFYEAFAARRGEAAGEYVEFVETLVNMIREDIDAGVAVSDVKQYLSALDDTRFDAALAALREQEREASEDLIDTFARQLAEKGDLKAFFQETYEALTARYPGESFNRFVFAKTLGGLLRDGAFDGSMNSLVKAVRTAQEAWNTPAGATTFAALTIVPSSEADAAAGKFTLFNIGAYMKSFAGLVIKTSDQSNSIGAVKILWWLGANVLLLWVCGIVLIIAAKVLDKVVTRVTMNRLEHAGIEEEDDVLLRVNHLKQYFRSGDYINKAVDDVSFYIKKGEVFGLVGESGCGKTTTGRTIINLYDPTEGDVYFQGLRISSTQNGLPVLIRSLRNEYNEKKRLMEAELKEQCLREPARKAELTAKHKATLAQMRQEMSQKISQARTNALESSVEKSKCTEKYREKRKAELTAQYEADMKNLSGEEAAQRKARYEIDMKVAASDNIMTKMQMIFQDPIASINPRMTVREIIAEGLKIRGIKDEKYIDQKVYEVLDLVGLVREHAARYPHEFSGGQRQRIGIARAIVLEPDLIIADEPISALDVSIQAQVINLLNDLRNKMGLTIMFIAHNLSVVKYFSDRIGVMYYGKLVELTTADELFEHPLHPYTKSLLSAIPYPDPHHEKHRKRIEYNPRKVHDYSVDKPSLHEIKPGHFIHCNEAELEQYKKELGI